ncbi:potassium transporter TrkH [Archangium lipolyticum]|uniref:potassium transporter TrkH n=1 Tax=Archangium lipolyticum TaxID=2970465 RepID=UPI00214A871E|nr:potassium transporter TrkH [Archangium lipolyticum]
MARVCFGRWVCEVEDALLDAARPRCSDAPFLVEEGRPRLRLRRLADLGEGARPFQTGQPSLGAVRVEEDGLATDAPLELLPAELALRALFQLAILRQGGLCLHAAGVAFGEEAVVALGISGAGKSTLSRLCVQSGRAALLSDEVVALLPDGLVCGSPFRSEPDLPATRTEARLHAFLLLEKGQVESISPVRPAALVAPLLGQVFQGEGGTGLSLGAATLPRLGGLMAPVPGFRLTFRKDPAVAGFLDEWMHGLTPSRG